MAILNNDLPNTYTEYPRSFSRQGSYPLERYSVFYALGTPTDDGTDTAYGYAKNSPLAYVGQRISVIEKNSNGAIKSVKLYLIANKTGALKLTGPSIVKLNNEEEVVWTETKLLDYLQNEIIDKSAKGLYVDPKSSEVYLIDGDGGKIGNSVTISGDGSVKNWKTYELVTSLPTSSISTDTIYLIKKAEQSENNKYDKYIYINGEWEVLGGESHVSETTAVVNTKVIDAAGNYTLHMEDNCIYKINNVTNLYILPPTINPTKYFCHMYIALSSDADFVSINLPNGLANSGDPVDLAEPGDRWEISIDSNEDAFCLRKWWLT